MMKPAGALTQVREGNFPGEIPDGISPSLLVLYRTACQGRCGVCRLHSVLEIWVGDCGSSPRACGGPLASLGAPLPYEEASFSCLLVPTVRRRRLGAELRRLREAHSLKLEEVAEKLGLAPSTLSRIETGKAPTKSAYLTAMLEMYEVEDPGARKVLVDMAREGHRKGWWSIYDDVLPSGFDIYVGLEAEASGLRSYESDVIHGLLQTTDYALTVLRELRPKDTEEQLARGRRPAHAAAAAARSGSAARRLDHPRRGCHQAQYRRHRDHAAPASAPGPGEPVAERDPADPRIRMRRARGPDRAVRHPRISRADRLRRRLHRISGRHDLPGKRPGGAGLRRGIRPDAGRGAVPGRLDRADPAGGAELA